MYDKNQGYQVKIKRRYTKSRLPVEGSYKN